MIVSPGPLSASVSAEKIQAPAPSRLVTLEENFPHWGPSEILDKSLGYQNVPKGAILELVIVGGRFEDIRN